MNLHLTRTKKSQDGIFSSLSRDDDRSQVCVTLEHAYATTGLESGIYAPKITAGVHECVRGKHRLHGMTEDFETFEITGVEGHTNLLFHWGNWNDNSDGCALTGEAEAQGEHAGRKHVEMVTNSRAAFEKFMALQDGADRFTLTVEEAHV